MKTRHIFNQNIEYKHHISSNVSASYLFQWIRNGHKFSHITHIKWWVFHLPLNWDRHWDCFYQCRVAEVLPLQFPAWTLGDWRIDPGWAAAVTVNFSPHGRRIECCIFLATTVDSFHRMYLLLHIGLGSSYLNGRGRCHGLQASLHVLVKGAKLQCLTILWPREFSLSSHAGTQVGQVNHNTATV